ncbi:MAG: NAD-dependent protein deacylase [Coriobacteriia bacterium]|nr:NAD-dependent protein deacylase [Coriobacteriia bacterium]
MDLTNDFEKRLKSLRAIVAKSTKVVFFGGAGVSTESGIPDFRSADGIYSKKSDYPPEYMLSYEFYRDHREEFFANLFKIGLDTHAQPNAAHKALAALEARGNLAAVITQNIDGLHQAAGSKVVHELHGSMSRHYCERCGAFYTLEDVKAQMDTTGRSPYCTKEGCGGPIKPDVVLYGESLDQAVIQAAIEAIIQADVLIVGGTSLVVHPAASFVRLFRGSHLVVINREQTYADSQADLVFRESIGTVLGVFLES